MRVGSTVLSLVNEILLQFVAWTTVKLDQNTLIEQSP